MRLYDDLLQNLHRLRMIAAGEHVTKRHAVLRSLLLRRPHLADEDKAGFRPDQPRYPRGSGAMSGRWSGGAGVAPQMTGPSLSPRGSGGGHHYVPKEVINDPELDLSERMKKVLRRSTTGRLPNGMNTYNQAHREYSRAVKELVRSFMSETSIPGSEMTEEHANELVRRVKRSSDPRIRNFNMQMWRARFKFIFRRIPFRGRGFD